MLKCAIDNTRAALAARVDAACTMLPRVIANIVTSYASDDPVEYLRRALVSTGTATFTFGSGLFCSNMNIKDVCRSTAGDIYIGLAQRSSLTYSSISGCGYVTDIQLYRASGNGWATRSRIQCEIGSVIKSGYHNLLENEYIHSQYAQHVFEHLFANVIADAHE